MWRDYNSPHALTAAGMLGVKMSLLVANQLPSIKAPLCVKSMAAILYAQPVSVH